MNSGRGARCGPFGTALRKDDYVRHGVPVWGIDNVYPNRFVEEERLVHYARQVRGTDGVLRGAGRHPDLTSGHCGADVCSAPTSSPSIIGTNLIRVALDRNRIVPEYVTAIFTYFPTRVGGLRDKLRRRRHTRS